MLHSVASDLGLHSLLIESGPSIRIIMVNMVGLFCYNVVFW